MITDNSQMKNNILNETARIAEIVSHAGKFKENYDKLIKNIVSSMNTTLKNYVKNSRKAILCDIYEHTLSKINWDEMRTRFNKDIKGNKLLVNRLYTIGDDLKNYSLEEYNTEILMNMMINLDEDTSTIKKFIKLQDEALNALDELNEELSNFEANLCSYRTKAINVMLENVDNLYRLHVNYAKKVLNNEYVDDSINVQGVTIKMYKSQQEFIKNAMKSLLRLH